MCCKFLLHVNFKPFSFEGCPIEIIGYRCIPSSATKGDIGHVWNGKGLHVNGGRWLTNVSGMGILRRGGGYVVTLVNGTSRSNTGGYVEHEMGTYPLPLQNNHRQFTPSLFSPSHVIWTINYYYISLHCKAAATENIRESKRATWYNIVLRKLAVIHLFIRVQVFVEVLQSDPLDSTKILKNTFF